MDKPMRRCADCGVPAPVTSSEEGSTLLTVKYGWRLRRGTDEHGARRIEARCPSCYNRARAAAPDAEKPSGTALTGAPTGVRPMTEDDGELVLGFPHNLMRAQVQEPTRISTTFLAVSQASLTKLGLYDKYLRLLPDGFRDRLKTVIPGGFCGTDLAMAHYEACDRLGLSEAEIIRASRDIGADLQEAVVRLASVVGKAPSALDPWFILREVHGALARYSDGAGMALYKLGAKDARLEIAGFPFARINYVRVALRGALHSTLQRFSTSVQTADVPRLCTARIVAYRLSWT